MSMFEHNISLIEEAQVLQTAIPDGAFEWRMSNVEAALQSLGSQAIARGDLNGQFVVAARSAFSRAESMREGKHAVVMFESVAIRGHLQDFSYLIIGRLGSGLVSSLCADFENVILFPGGEALPQGDILHVPVLSVEQALRVA